MPQSPPPIAPLDQVSTSLQEPIPLGRKTEGDLPTADIPRLRPSDKSTMVCSSMVVEQAAHHIPAPFILIIASCSFDEIVPHSGMRDTINQDRCAMVCCRCVGAS